MTAALFSLPTVPREEFRSADTQHIGMFSRIMAASPPVRRGDAAAGTLRCECNGTITYAREERTGDLRAACNGGCGFKVEG